MDQAWRSADGDFDTLLSREWLVTNSLGGYASSTVLSLNTRKYHGMLVAAMTPPARRVVLLSRVEETVVCANQRNDLACNEYPGTIHPRGDQLFQAFEHEPFPRWAYQDGTWTLEKQLRLLQDENTVVLTYTILGHCPNGIGLELRPLLAMRGIHDLAFQWNGPLGTEQRSPGHHRVPPTSRNPEVFFAHTGTFEPAPFWYLNTIYRRERERGYAGLEDVWSPGVVRFALAPGKPVHFVCSADTIQLEKAVARAKQQGTTSIPTYRPTQAASPDCTLDVLCRAAEQFVVQDRAAPAAVPVDRKHVEPRISSIAGYPWMAASGRVALMGFSGLFLVPGRFDAARSVLLDMASRTRDGLMPSEFPESGAEPVYRGADVFLWFANALYQYLRYTDDEDTVWKLVPGLLTGLERYRLGTRLGIIADVRGLLASGQPGEATTWMDAKVGDWVITPRAGRAVEINALWYNALRIGGELAQRFDLPEQAASLAALARTVHSSFNQFFWNEQAGYCYDVLNEHGVDASLRPNQLLAMSLPFPVLDVARHERVLESVGRELLTPVGLRTLSPRDPSYLGRYGGDIVARDRAYHDGAAWPWLLGPLITATIRVRGRSDAARVQARELLMPCIRYMMTDGIGQLCELFDGDAPHRPNGAVASALSVAELLRAYAEDILDLPPHGSGLPGLGVDRLGSKTTAANPQVRSDSSR